MKFRSLGFFLILIATSARADGTSDAAAASDAYSRGDFKTALALYSRAMQDAALTPPDRVSMLVNRGVVYGKLGQHALAIGDFKAVLRLDPSDPDASGLLAIENAALQPRRARPGVSARTSVSAAPAVNYGRWGPLAYLAGKDWIGLVGQPVFYLRYEWAVPNSVLMYQGQDAGGHVLQGQVFADPATDALSEQSSYNGKSSISSIEISGMTSTSIDRAGGKVTQQTITRAPDGTFRVVTQRQSGNTWKALQTVLLIPTSPQYVANLGWPVPGTQVHESFLKGIGRSLKSGALAGVHDGMQDGVHDAVQDRVRRITGTKGAETQTVRTVQSQ